uniref:Uncharacterized protein n=1 Tax=Anguilla anguilla TaxID=7936 RepID=A0A0E9T737_ANGAN
MGKQATLR